MINKYKSIQMNTMGLSQLIILNKVLFPAYFSKLSASGLCPNAWTLVYSSTTSHLVYQSFCKLGLYSVPQTDLYASP
jgi:hypothetical protein